MPKHALIPLFIMWVGIGSELRVLTAAAIVFFLVFYNTFFGIRDVSKNLVDSVRVMGGTAFDVLFRVMLPSALIWVFAALKLAVPKELPMASWSPRCWRATAASASLVAMHAGNVQQRRQSSPRSSRCSSSASFRRPADEPRDAPGPAVKRTTTPRPGAAGRDRSVPARGSPRPGHAPPGGHENGPPGAASHHGRAATPTGTRLGAIAAVGGGPPRASTVSNSRSWTPR